MKTFRLPVLALTGWLCLSLIAHFPAHAQDSNPVITLDDAMPGIDVVINLPPSTAGTIAVDLSQASVTLKDASGKVEFYLADPRAHAVELALMADSGTHTLSVSRLPGAGTAYVTLAPQTSLSQRQAGDFVPSGALTLGQQQQAILNATGSGSTIPVDIPAGDLGAITAQFQNTPLTAQLTDASGSTVGTLYGGAVDGLSVTLDGGSYLMTLLNSEGKPAIAGLNVSSVETDSLVAFAPASTEAVPLPAATLIPNTPAPNVAALSVVTAQPATCALTIGGQSVNFRSGPGTGYAVVGHGGAGSQFAVSGRNAEGSWLVVTGDQGGLLWVLGSLGSRSGSCDGLAIYDLPVRSAAPVQPNTNLGSGNDNLGAGNDDRGGLSGGNDDLSAGNQGNDDRGGLSGGNDDLSAGNQGNDDSGHDVGDDHGGQGNDDSGNDDHGSHGGDDGGGDDHGGHGGDDSGGGHGGHGGDD